MRLTKIKLAGFKSFVDPTSVGFPTNLVGVVGPLQLDVLRADNRAIFRAASAASKAADWLRARHGAREAHAA